jgi:hypothetical protein
MNINYKSGECKSERLYLKGIYWILPVIRRNLYKYDKKVKIKQSHYRPGQPLRVPGV